MDEQVRDMSNHSIKVDNIGTDALTEVHTEKDIAYRRSRL